MNGPLVGGANQGFQRLLRLWFTALLALAALVGQWSGRCWALPFDPNLPDPIGSPNFTPPVNGFVWSMLGRFGNPDSTGSKIDFHWHNGAYDPGYVLPATTHSEPRRLS